MTKRISKTTAAAALEIVAAVAAIETDASQIPLGTGPFVDVASEPDLQPTIDPTDEILDPTEIMTTEEYIASIEPEILTPSETDAIEAIDSEAIATEATGTEIVVLEAEAIADPANIEPTETLSDAIASLSEGLIDQTLWATADAVDERVTFELAKDSDNTNIQRTLTKARNQLVSKRAAAILAVAYFDPAEINREIHGGSRYNVYALGKLADIIYGVSGGTISNAINVAVLKSMIAFRAAGVAFTGEMARAAASDKIRVEPAFRRLLTSHTVSEGTAPTQASSTMAALETLGIVKRTGTSRAPVYTMIDGPLTSKIEEVLAA